MIGLLIDQSNRQFHAAHLKGAVPKPLNLPRPGEQAAPAPAKSDPEDVKHFFKGGR
jgi:hypothetical protein